MISYGLDYSARIPAQTLLDAGFHVVFRYVTSPNWPKSLTIEEYGELTAAGIVVILNDETTADFMLGGYAAGVVQAQTSRARANVLGASPDAIIFYSLDIGATPDQVSIALDFLHGALDAEGGQHNRVGAYGEYAFVKAAASAGFPTWGTVAWSQGQRDPRAIGWQTGTQQQVGGVTVDVNDLNPSVFRSVSEGSVGTYTVGAGWQHDYPDVAAAMQQHIPVGTVVDETDAAAFAMMRSFVAAERTNTLLTNDQAILAAITALGNQLGKGAVDQPALVAAVVAGVAPLLDRVTGGLVNVTPDAEQVIADAIAAHFKVV